MGRLEIEPGSVAQVKRALSGRLVEIPDDVCGVVRDLRAIDSRFRVEAEDDLSLYIVFLQDGPKQHLVTTARQLDQRIVQRIREVSAPDYNFAAELDRVEAEADRKQDARRHEQVGDIAERLSFAFRKDFQRNEVTNTLKSRAAGFALKD